MRRANAHVSLRVERSLNASTGLVTTAQMRTSRTLESMATPLPPSSTACLLARQRLCQSALQVGIHAEATQKLQYDKVTRP